jgi:hypothetical protein
MTCNEVFPLQNGTFLVVHWATGFSSSFSLERKIILDSHWFMKDEGAIDWWERFPTSIGQGSKVKEGSWRGTKEDGSILFFWGGKQKIIGGVRKR